MRLIALALLPFLFAMPGCKKRPPTTNPVPTYSEPAPVKPTYSEPAPVPVITGEAPAVVVDPGPLKPLPRDDTPQRNAMRISAAEVINVLNSPAALTIPTSALYQKCRGSTTFTFMVPVIDGIFKAAGVATDSTTPLTVDQRKALIAAFDLVGE